MDKFLLFCTFLGSLCSASYSNTCTDPDLRVSLHFPANKSLGSRTSSSFMRSTLSLKLWIFVFTSKTKTPLVSSRTSLSSAAELKTLRLISVMLYIDSFALLVIWVKKGSKFEVMHGFAIYCVRTLERENGDEF